MIERESMQFDVVIVGAGPAGLSAAISLAQLNQSCPRPLSICVLEKGSSVGAHILSGAILQPSTLNQLIPDWQQKEAPLQTLVNEDRFYYLTAKNAWRVPILPSMHNQGNYIISLGVFCQWLAQQAEALGVSIFPSFAASKVLYDTNQQKVIGVQTNDIGLNKDGTPSENFQPGIELYAKQTLFAEGCRGSLSELVIKHFNLRANSDPQSYGIGVKELWEVDPKQFQPGKVIHTVGWPLDKKTYGGSFLYHYLDNKVAVGFVCGLDYQNPYLDPFQELQRFKTHPFIKSILQGGRCLSYGARALNEGGWQSIPKLTFPGGLLLGCSAGFLNVAKIKGIHNAMLSGMIAAKTIQQSSEQELTGELVAFQQMINQSSIVKELYAVRNVRPGFHYGLWSGLINAGVDQLILRGKAPWTLRYRHPDYTQFKLATQCSRINYPKADGKLTFSKVNQVFLSNTMHHENQPCHLQLKDPSLAISVNFEKYASPEQYYCPANVYEIIQTDQQPKLQINFSNCVHCKTCDIKDPLQNIVWTTPEGGDGPNYLEM